MGRGGKRLGAGRPRGSSAPCVPVVKETREDVRAIARGYGPAAMSFLASTMDSDNVPYSARVVAAKEILDRGYGRPHQAEAPPEPKTIQGIVIEPLGKPSNGHDGPVKLEDWRSKLK